MHQRRGSWYSNFWVNCVRYQKSWGAISKTEAKEKERKEKENVRLQYCNSGSSSPTDNQCPPKIVQRLLPVTRTSSRLGCPALVALPYGPILPISSLSVKLHSPIHPLCRMIMLFKMIEMMKRRTIQS